MPPHPGYYNKSVKTNNNDLEAEPVQKIIQNINEKLLDE